MSDLTLDEKLACAGSRARQLVAEEHFFDAAQPFFPLGFSVGYRNPGHWDVYARKCPGEKEAAEACGGQLFAGKEERAFRIRGEPGRVVIYDERWNPRRPHPREHLTFRSVTGAMLWIVEELMQEPAALSSTATGAP